MGIPHVLLQSVHGKHMYHGRQCSSFNRDPYDDLYGKKYTVGHDTFVFHILTVVGHEVYTHHLFKRTTVLKYLLHMLHVFLRVLSMTLMEFLYILGFCRVDLHQNLQPPALKRTKLCYMKMFPKPELAILKIY